MDIRLIRRHYRKCFFLKIRNHLEDTILSIIQKIPEHFIPCWLMELLNRYLDRRISELKQQSIKLAWANMYLRNVVDDIRKSK